MDDLGREAMTAVAERSHADILADPPLAPDPVSVTMLSGDIPGASSRLVLLPRHRPAEKPRQSLTIREVGGALRDATKVKVLGITHPISWNPAACLLVNGELVAFAEEERFIRFKHAPHIHPARAIDFCLQKAALRPVDIESRPLDSNGLDPGTWTP